MITRHPYGNITWIDIEYPTNEEILEITSHYDIPFDIGQELMQSSPYSKVQELTDSLYVVLHFPHTNDTSSKETNEQEIDCIIGKEFLITVRYSPVDSVMQFEKIVEMKNMLNQEEEGITGMKLFTHLLKIFYDNMTLQNTDIADSLKKIESRVFAGDETRMVQALSSINRRLIDQRRSLTFHNTTLDSIIEKSKSIFTREQREDLENLERNYQTVSTLLSSNKNILDDLKDTNDLLLNTKTNKIMKMIGIITFISVPLLVGMEVLKGPIEAVIHTPFSITVISIIAILAVLGLYAFFKQKGWF